MPEPHLDFTNATEEARWTGGSTGLFAHLSLEAFKAKGQWASVVLPNGTWLDLRIRAELGFRAELRIRRSKAPSEGSWRAQIEAIQAKVTPDRGRRWDEPRPYEVDPPGIAVSMLSLFPTEMQLGKFVCDCGAEHAVSERCLWYTMEKTG